MDARDDAGLTLLELLIVVALISIIAAFALPRLLRAQSVANETSAIASLRAVAIGEDLFSRFCGAGGYADSLPVLGQVPPGGGSPFLAPDLATSATPSKAGYTFTVASGAGAVAGLADCHGNPTLTKYYASAEPLSVGVTGRRSFALTTPLVIWQLPGGSAPAEPFGAPAEPIQ